MTEKKDFKGRTSISGLMILFTYYFLIFILGISLSLYIYFATNSTSLLTSSIFISKDGNIIYYNIAMAGSIGTSLVGCSIYYTRKLYKLSLGKNIDTQIETHDEKLENIGTLYYFFLRPFFAIAFALLLLLVLKSGILFISNKSSQLNSNFSDLAMFLSFLVGFSTGKFLSSLESKSEKFIEGLVNGMNTPSKLK